MKTVRIIALAALFLLIGRGWSEPILHIPVFSFTTPEISVRYRVESTRTESSKARTEFLAAKRQQYEALTSRGDISKEHADETLAALEKRPLKTESKYTIQFSFLRDHSLVTVSAGNGRTVERWSYFTTGYVLTTGFLGGDALNLKDVASPYADSNAMLPLLPIQLRDIKTFVDIDVKTSEIAGKTLSVSTQDDRYLPASFEAKNGHLAVVDISGLERWTYEEYPNKENDPFPYKITLERLFDSNGNPQVQTVFTRVPCSVDKRELAELIPGEKIDVLDLRTDPMKQFTYTKGGPDILEQAMSATPVPGYRQPGRQLVSSISISNVLLALGMLVLLVVSLVKLFRRSGKKTG